MDENKRNLLKGLLQGLRAKKGHKMFDKEDKEDKDGKAEKDLAPTAKKQSKGATLALIVANVINKKGIKK